MALTGDGGLDAQVEQRMDTYRGNPTQLQKRYGQSKELLDLLALQKLTAEKKEVAAAMQLEQAQQPGTIAEQRETEALELIKQEQAGTLGELQARTSATLGQKQKMQGRGMQKIAQGAGRPPQQAGGIAGLTRGQPARPPMPPQGGPQAAGLPNARMMQAARGGPVRRMAGGGIVGFAGEDGNNQVKKKRTLTEEQKQAFRDKFGGAANRYINQVEAGTLGPLSAGRGTRDDIAAILGDPVAASPERSADPLRLANPPAALGDSGGASLGGIPPSYGVPDQIQQPPPAGIQTLIKPEDTGREFVGPDMIGPDMSGMDAYTQTPTVEKPAFEGSDGSNAPQIDAADKPPMVGGQDPMDAMQKGFAASDAYTGRAEKAAEFDDMLKEMKDFDAENYDPERERNDRLKSFLIGAAGTTNVGATFASAGAASMNLGSKQRVDRRSRLEDKFQLQKDAIGIDAALAQTGVGLGKELYSQASQDSRAAMQAGVTMRGQDLNRLAQNAQLKLDTMKNDDLNSWKEITAAQAQNELDAKILNDANTSKNARIGAANDTILRTLKAREYFAAEAALTMNLEGKRLALENAEFSGLSPTDIEAAQIAYDDAAAEALVLGESMMNGFGRGGTAENPTGSSLLDAEQLAIKILAGYGLNEDGSTISTDDVEGVTTTGN